MNYYIYYPPELYHHGVKGMRWGVRKDKAYAAYSKSKRRISSYADKNKFTSKIKKQVQKQLKTSESYANQHSTAGIIARQYGKSVAQGITITFGSIPLAMLAGPAAPVVASGSLIAEKILIMNNVQKTTASIGYKIKNSK